MATLNGGETWIGRTIDQYHVLNLIGAGGMGVVYRARDTKLGRDVALKVLPEELSHDRDRMLRSEREARLLASLNHPNIAIIFDLKESEGNRCLVLEYVDGETLAERLKRGRIPLNETFDIAQQVADALDAAHRANIFHRDIKPANIKIRSDGRIKVLDFGLAKSVTNEVTGYDPTSAPTLITQVLTEPIAGTPAYMSPEQVRGELLDRRVDIWAFGCVLYEMLSGRQAFSGRAVPEIIASVLKSDPDWTALPPDTPPAIHDLLQHCLEKDVMRRLNDGAVLRVELLSGIRAPTKSSQQEAPGNTVSSLAVLPFVNAGGNPEGEYLSDGLTENIIFSLSRLPQLRVISRSAVFRYKGRSDEPQKAGRELGVSAVLTGRVLQRNEILLITAELVDVENGWQLWGDQYRRKSGDIFSIEEDIAREISEKLRLKLTPENKSLLSRRYTDNVAAYHLYLKGRYHWAKRTAEGLNRSIQYFREAIEGDPTYALAYAGLAEGYIPLGVYCHTAPSDAFPKARSAAEKALEIDPELAEARTVLAAIRSFFDWDLAGGEKEARAAIQIRPNYPRARQVLSECLTLKGEFSEAVAEVMRALDLDPLSLHMNAAVELTYYCTREYERAIEHGRKTLEMDPHFFPAYFYLGLALSAHGKHSEAVAALQQAATLSGNSTLMRAALGGAFASWGKEEEARRILLELEEIGTKKYVSQLFVAAIHAGLGENTRALTCLGRACDDRDPWVMRFMASDSRLDRLRHEPPYRSLLHRLRIEA
jgi:serine/threonine protein kinase/Flp pilus assembly protein TadD